MPWRRGVGPTQTFEDERFSDGVKASYDGIRRRPAAGQLRSSANGGSRVVLVPASPTTAV